MSHLYIFKHCLIVSLHEQTSEQTKDNDENKTHVYVVNFVLKNYINKKRLKPVFHFLRLKIQQ